MKFTAEQIATVLEGDIVGDKDAQVFKLSKIEEGEPGSLSFLSNPKYTPFIYDTKATVVIVNRSFVPEKDISCTLIKVSDAYQSFSKLLSFYQQSKEKQPQLESPHFIHDSATIGKNVYIGSFVYIGANVKIADGVKIYPNSYIGDNVTIGLNTLLYSGVKVYDDCQLGASCVIHSGAVIGADGFGFAPDENGVYEAIPQIGNVVLEDYVSIGANTTIDCATLGSTIIRKGAKIDNLIQIAHNVEIGENTVIAAHTGIAGSTKVGKGCMIGGQVAISGHLHIGDYVKIQGNSGISRNIKSNAIVKGSPAIDVNKWNKAYVYFKQLPELNDTINSLKKEIKALKEIKDATESKYN